MASKVEGRPWDNVGRGQGAGCRMLSAWGELRINSTSVWNHRRHRVAEATERLAMCGLMHLRRVMVEPAMVATELVQRHGLHHHP